MSEIMSSMLGATMSNAMADTGKTEPTPLPQNDGASMPTKRAIEKALPGFYSNGTKAEDTGPKYKTGSDQIVKDSAPLEAALMKRPGMTKERAREMIKQQGRDTGIIYK